MKWPWSKPDDEPVRTARRFRDAAAERLAAAMAREAEVREIAEWSRRRRERNHLTELFYEIREGRA
ncbi:DUF7620 family protein [Mumia sp. DW29H23]|uniref:DUF7620 family protein n=1 Tax=Mumia sp. DW29H23 TaxID=3421241 RepID=UPI003D68ED19